MHLRDVAGVSTKRREWRLERIGWGLLLVFLLLGALGIFGGGPLSGTTVVLESSEGARFVVAYEKWDRRNHVSTMTVMAEAPPGAKGDLVVALGPSIVPAWTIRSTHPAADGGLGPEGILYRFPVGSWSEPVHAGFEYVPQQAGRVHAELALAVGEADPARGAIRQFVHP